MKRKSLIRSMTNGILEMDNRLECKAIEVEPIRVVYYGLSDKLYMVATAIEDRHES